MSDHRSWLQECGYADDKVEGAVVYHRILPNEARVTVRLDEDQWSVVSFANRADDTSISFVITGIANDQLKEKLKTCEGQLSWLFDQFNGR